MAEKFQAFELFSEDMQIIQLLGDNPNLDNGLNAEELKAKFDEAGVKIKEYLINMVSQMNVLVSGLNSLFENTGEVLNGGTMMGPLNMSGNKLSGIPSPEADDDAVNKAYTDAINDTAIDAANTAQLAQETADDAMFAVQEVKDNIDAKHHRFTVTLTAGNWVGNSAPYIQIVSMTDMKKEYEPHYGVVYDSDQSTRLAQKEAFAMVDDLDTADGSATFTCFEDKPAVDLVINMEVNL